MAVSNYGANGKVLLLQVAHTATKTFLFHVVTAAYFITLQKRNEFNNIAPHLPKLAEHL